MSIRWHTSSQCSIVYPDVWLYTTMTDELGFVVVVFAIAVISTIIGRNSLVVLILIAIAIAIFVISEWSWWCSTHVF